MNFVDHLKNKIIRQSRFITPAEAMELFIEASGFCWSVLAAASEIREHFKGKKIIFCGITNAKSGRCPEDCMFCAQSSHYKTTAHSYPLKKSAQIIADAEKAVRNGAECFGIVTSGKQLKSKKERLEIIRAIQGVRETGLFPCASLGMIDKATAMELKAAGLFRYHHNLETSRSFFKTVCTTHDYEESVKTLCAAKEAGLSVCSGALIGMGENISHRIELAQTLRKLDVDSVPLNILHPVKGTPLSHMRALPPMEILMTLAVFRFMLPYRDIRLCGGKEKNLRQLLPLGIVAGANALMTGDYLTTAGQNSSLDHEMIADLGLTATRERITCTCNIEKHSRPVARQKRRPVQKHPS
ncbi:MAG TPA: biotin synthase BioB [Smithella sp.]|nr:biotin synthase BioB [Smithella sp.]